MDIVKVGIALAREVMNLKDETDEEVLVHMMAENIICEYNRRVINETDWVWVFPESRLYKTIHSCRSENPSMWEETLNKLAVKQGLTVTDAKNPINKEIGYWIRFPTTDQLKFKI